MTSSGNGIEFPISRNLEAEQSVLGAAILDNGVLDEVYFLSERDFSREPHRNIWRAMLALRAKGEPVDVVTLTLALEASKLLEGSGGLNYLTTLAETTPTTANVKSWGQIVRDAGRKRRLSESLNRLARLSADPGVSADGLQAEAERAILSASEDSGDDMTRDAGDFAQEIWERQDRAWSNPDQEPTLLTGFQDLDRLYGGCEPGELILVAGRPGMGKSAFVGSLARNLGQRGLSVLVFALEMTGAQIVGRLAADLGRLPSDKLVKARLAADSAGRFTDALSEASKLPILINPDSRMSIPKLASICRRWKARRQNLAAIAIDHIGLMAEVRADSRSRYMGASFVSNELKCLAKELNLPIFACSQLNRANEMRSSKRPMLSDLRETGHGEQDADAVWFLHRPEYYVAQAGEAVPPEQEGLAEVIVAKARSGRTGIMRLRFVGWRTAFEDWSERGFDNGWAGSIE